MPKRLLSLSVILLAGLLPHGVAHAWGDRGHDLVTRVAARLLIARHARDRRLTTPFFAKETMLGYLSNVPDIVWRGLGKEVDAVGGPTHYFDLERLGPARTLKDLPRTAAALEAALQALCAKPPPGYTCQPPPNGQRAIDQVGTAPFRVEQFANRITADLGKAKRARPAGKEYTEAIDEALTDAAFLSHFVADLGQPYHTTVDYNGFGAGHGGIHVYFEADLVNAQDLRLSAEVFDLAMTASPFETLVKSLPPDQGRAGRDDALTVAYALALDSYAHIAEVSDLDAKYAITSPSRTHEGLMLKAERRDPMEVAAHFRAIIVARLATSADTLAHLWQTAWEKAGAPDLTDYQSRVYPAAPAFVRPDYL